MRAPDAPGGDCTSEVVVLGAGIAGLFAARQLAAAGYSVTVVERSEICGGAHRSVTIGPYTFDAGSFFYSEAAPLFDLAPGLRESCPEVRRQQRRISPDGTLKRYPLHPREVLEWRKPALARAILDLSLSRLRHRRDGTLERICLSRLGRSVFEGTGLHSYIERFHHVPAAQVDESFFFQRMSYIEKATRPLNLVSSAARTLGAAVAVQTQWPTLRVRPEAGFATFFGPIRAELEARGVRFRMSETLEGITKRRTDFVVSTDRGTLRANAVVSTIALDDLHKALFGERTGLVSLDLLTLFVSAGKLHPGVGNVLFNFHRDGRWKRATIYSRIYGERGSGREFFGAEVTLPPGQAPDPQCAFKDLQRHLTGLGLAENLQLEGHTVIDNAYPHYRPGESAMLAGLLEKIKTAGLVTVGRQGRFEYLPTSSGVIQRVGEELGQATLPPAVPVSTVEPPTVA